MRSPLQIYRRLTNYRRHVTILPLIFIVFVAVLSAVLAAKYRAYGYNAIDLGIYNQVFWNMAAGRWFEFSIHPHLYLGDHLELLIAPLSILYLVARSPVLLLVLQGAAVAAAIWPLYAIARRWLTRHWSLLVVALFLLNPVTLNTLFFEFHLLPFAVPIIAWMFRWYLERRYTPFVIAGGLALMVREDVSLILIGFGLLALADRRPLRWWIPPVIVGAAWLVAATKLTGIISGYGSYKFAALYGWLGSGAGEMTRTVLTHPWVILQHLFTLNNLLLVVGLLLPVLLLPLIRSRYLLPAAPVALQLFLAGLGSTVVLQTHYAVLFTPFLAIGAAAGLGYVLNETHTGKIPTFLRQQKTLTVAIIVLSVCYSAATFSPLPAALKNAVQSPETNQLNTIRDSVVAGVNETDAVLASFEFLPALSSRQHLYSLHYAFLGRKQFSDEPYTITQPLDAAAIDFNDFTIYSLQSQNITSYREQYAGGADRVRQYLADNQLGLVSIADTYALYRRGSTDVAHLVEQAVVPPANLSGQPQPLDANLAFAGWTPGELVPGSVGTVPVSLYWQVTGRSSGEYQLELTKVDGAGTVVYRKLYPLGYGLWGVASWQPDSTVRTNYWFAVPPEYLVPDYQTSVRVVSIRGYLDLDSLRTA
ncbi:MAG: DUF2079 domain-containing protein, partial [Patescibacteria group bacterium]